MTQSMADSRPVVALTLGDPAGIGPELVAKLLADDARWAKANIVIVGDPWLWREGQRIAGLDLDTIPLAGLDAVRDREDSARPAFVALNTVEPEAVSRGKAKAAGGRSVLDVLNHCMRAAGDRWIDAICFAPLNKYAMKQGGLAYEDELHHFADYLGVRGFFSEFNILGSLWTTRVSSHVPLKDVTRYLDKDRIKDAARLIVRSLQASGVAQPRVAIAALNPHAGEGGTCGREEIDVIRPAIEELAADGWPVAGPLPADTVFVRAREAPFDGVVTMYHDQGQIALKLLGFSQGVTVHGGLPVPITTPAHGTAYDIAGRGIAEAAAMTNAFAIACRMGSSYRNREGLFTPE